MVAARVEINAVIEFTTRYAVDNTNITVQGITYETSDVVRRCQGLGNSLGALIFSVQNQLETSPYRMSTNLGLLLRFMETNQLIGWEAGQAEPTLRLLLALAEGHVGNGGVNIAFFMNMQRSLDLMYQLRMAYSLYYYHIE